MSPANSLAELRQQEYLKRVEANRLRRQVYGQRDPSASKALLDELQSWWSAAQSKTPASRVQLEGTQVTAPGALRSNLDRSAYDSMLSRAREFIFAGDIYQVNLSQRFQAPLRQRPFDLYLRLRQLNPAPFAAYLNFPEAQVLSASPERFLQFDPATRLMQTRPIKGTRPRGQTPERDRALAEGLISSEKDMAENVMIVDVERNDLGRVAENGTP